MSRGPDAVADLLAEMATGATAGLFAAATVTAVGDRTVTVTLPGSTTTSTWPRAAGVVPAVGDQILLVGAPGEWTAVAVLAGPRAVSATRVDATEMHATTVAAERIDATEAHATTYGQHYGGVDSGGADTFVNAGVDVNAGRNVFAGGAVFDGQGNVRNAPSRPEVKTDVQPLSAAAALAALARLSYWTFRYRAGAADRFAGPMLPELVDDPLLATMIRVDADGEPVAFNIQSMVGMLAATTPTVHATLTEARWLAERVAALEARLDAAAGFYRG